MKDYKGIGNYFTVERITLALRGSDPPGCEYRNYKNGRGVCGIVVALDGSSEYCFSDGRTRILSKGEIALFSDKSAYVICNKSISSFPHYTINFSLGEHCSLPADETYIKTDNLLPYIEKCEKLLFHARSGEPMSYMKSMSYLYSLLADILGSESIEMIDREDYRSILPAISYIETNYGSNINTDILAKQCMMSNTNFRRVFRGVCGVPPIEYLLKTRIERARELLCQTSMSISDISFHCGFKDTEHFCRTFKKRTGNTAGNMRKGAD